MPEGRSEYSDEAELDLLAEVAEEALGLRFDKIIHRGFEGNLVGIKSQSTSFSRRLDSRTYFVHDTTFGTGRSADIFRGTPEEHFEVCRSILKRLQISGLEIARESLLKEQTQVAAIDRLSHKIVKEPIEDGKYFARLSRQLDGLPVWDSLMVLGLAESRRIGYLHLHWPEIPSSVLREAQSLAYKVSNDWKPPEQAGGSIESIEAGIIHSPAIGFFMDTYAAVRVVYRSSSEQHRQRPMYFYDRHGKAVPIPRQISLPVQESVPQRQETIGSAVERQ